MAGPTSPDDEWSTPNYRGAGVQVGSPQPDVGSESDWSTPTTRKSVPEPDAAEDDWSRSGPVSAREQRATRNSERRAEQDARRTERSVQALRERATPEIRPYERGLVWWLALAVLILVTVGGAIIDSIASIQGQNAFNIAIVLGSVAAILLVKRSQMFAIVVSPPIVYALTAVVQLYLKKSLSQDKHGALNAILNAVQNYLVYGFPALATATAAVLILAGIRMVLRRQHADPAGHPAQSDYPARSGR